MRSMHARSREAVSPHHPSHWLQPDAQCSSAFLKPQIASEQMEVHSAVPGDHSPVDI